MKGSAKVPNEVRNVETYDRSMEREARKIAQSGNSTTADRRALAEAIRQDAKRIMSSASLVFPAFK